MITNATIDVAKRFVVLTLLILVDQKIFDVIKKLLYG
jgi:hypothetical protein